MKVVIVLFFCVYSVLYIEPVAGQFLSNVFNPIKNNGRQNGNAGIGLNIKFGFGKSEGNNNMKKESTWFGFGSTPESPQLAPVVSTSPKATPVISTSSKLAPVVSTSPEPTPTASTSPKPTPVVPTTAPKNPVSNGTEVLDGRENFAAKCSSGYMKTADGRCMKLE